MIAYLLYNQATPYQRQMEEFAKRLEAEGVEVELTDADSPRGIQFAENYDVMARPAVVLVKDGGTPMQVWQGADSLPTVSDVAYLAHQ